MYLLLIPINLISFVFIYVYFEFTKKNYWRICFVMLGIFNGFIIVIFALLSFNSINLTRDNIIEAAIIVPIPCLVGSFIYVIIGRLLLNMLVPSANQTAQRL